MIEKRSDELTADDVETIVYRFFRADSRLLYVGVTQEREKRFLRHSERFWWPEVTRVRIESYATRGEALVVETEAISSEAPVHNLMKPEPAEISLPRPLSVVDFGIAEVSPRPRLRLAARR